VKGAGGIPGLVSEKVKRLSSPELFAVPRMASQGGTVDGLSSERRRKGHEAGSDRCDGGRRKAGRLHLFDAHKPGSPAMMDMIAKRGP